MELVYLIVVLGVIVVGFVQGLLGFVFGLVVMLFWVWILDLCLVVILLVFGVLVGQVLVVFIVCCGFELQWLLLFVLGGLVGILFGVVVLLYLDMDWFKVLFGGLLVIWCLVMLMVCVLLWIIVGGWIVDVVVGMVGGVLGGIGGFIGMLLMLWCMLCGMDKDVQCVIVQNFNLFMLLVMMGIYLVIGVVIWQVLFLFVIVVLVMLLFILFGVKLYVGISEVCFWQIVLGLFIVLGVVLFVLLVLVLLVCVG